MIYRKREKRETGTVGRVSITLFFYHLSKGGNPTPNETISRIDKIGRGNKTRGRGGTQKTFPDGNMRILQMNDEEEKVRKTLRLQKKTKGGKLRHEVAVENEKERKGRGRGRGV